MSNTIEVTEISNFSELSISELKQLAVVSKDTQLRNLLEAVIDVLVDERANTKHLEERAEHLEEMATTDSLTGLRNRRRFDEYLTKFANRYPKSLVAILFIDVDHLKQVNDTFGHTVGDETLKAVADRLTANSRPNDLICRIGGDEFDEAIIMHLKKRLYSL